MRVFINPYSSPGDVAHSTDASWDTIDLTTAFAADAGNVVGVCLQFNNSSGTAYTVGARHPDSTDDIKGVVGDGYAIQLSVGVNSSDQVEVYSQDASEVQVYVVGYWITGEAEFLTNAQEVTPGSASTWTATDLSSYFTGTVLAGLFICYDNYGNPYSVGGQDIDGPDMYANFGGGNQIMGGLAECTSEQCELWTGETSRIDIYCTGAVIDGFTKFSDSFDFTADNTWQEIDMTANIPAGGVAVTYMQHDGAGNDGAITQGHRAADQDTITEYLTKYTAFRQIGAINTTSRLFDQKTIYQSLENGYFYGYMTEAGGSPAASSITPRAHFLRSQQGVT